jgi:hypothetical protein
MLPVQTYMQRDAMENGAPRAARALAGLWLSRAVAAPLRMIRAISLVPNEPLSLEFLLAHSLVVFGE